jgi:hypothetical protein
MSDLELSNVNTMLETEQYIYLLYYGQLNFTKFIILYGNRNAHGI